MVVSPLWRGPGDIHGFVLDGKSYQQGKATDQTTTMSAVSSAKVTKSIKFACHLTTIVSGRWSFVTDLVK